MWQITNASTVHRTDYSTEFFLTQCTSKFLILCTTWAKNGLFFRVELDNFATMRGGKASEISNVSKFRL